MDRAEKQKKVREKAEKGSRKKEKAELVKVNDKVNQADNVQSEEVSISKELKHVLSVFKKELKKRQTDKLSYYEFVTNPKSFSRTVRFLLVFFQTKIIPGRKYVLCILSNA